MTVGVLTHYYKSTNYGGNLQAYALVRVLMENGVDAEQISYERKDDYIFQAPLPKHALVFDVLRKTAHFFRYYRINKRNRQILEFNQKRIPHSIEVYNQNNLEELQNHYDTFITGSDQVWHPKAVCDAYLLNFPVRGKRIAYAASFSINDLDESVKEYYRPCLKQMNAISVREKRGMELVDIISGNRAELVLDPTLLLTVDEWDCIREEAKIHKPYIFCYFLGCEKRHRDIVESIAKKNNLAIVTLPHLVSKNRADKRFGDYRLFHVTPGQLLSLIKYSQYIITDSYHACVFSVLYHKQFLVFDRLINDKDGQMGSRIDSLLKMFHLEQCRGDINASVCIPKVNDWEQVETILTEERRKSLAFLKHALDMKCS